MPTDYYRPIANAVGRLAPNTVAARRSIYDQARQLLFEEAQHARPPMAVSELFAEQRALEDAIERVEGEFAAEERPQRRVHPLQRQVQTEAEYPDDEAFHPHAAEEPVFVPEPGYGPEQDDPLEREELPEPEYVPEEHYDPEPAPQPDPRTQARAERLARQRPPQPSAEQVDERRKPRGARRAPPRRAASRKTSTHIVILIAALSDTTTVFGDAAGRLRLAGQSIVLVANAPIGKVPSALAYLPLRNEANPSQGNQRFVRGAKGYQLFELGS